MLSLIFQPVLGRAESPELRVVSKKPATQNVHIHNVYRNYFIASIAIPKQTASNNGVTVHYQTTRQLIRSGIEEANGSMIQLLFVRPI